MRSVLEEVVTRLSSALDVPVSASVPPSRPEKFVRVDPVGGSSTLDALHPEYAIQSWAKTDSEAEELARAICDAMKSLGATPLAVDPIRLGRDATHVWWQSTWAVHAIW